jgi:hypothetical protein
VEIIVYIHTPPISGLNHYIYPMNKNRAAMMKERIALLITVISVMAALFGLFLLLFE